MQQKESIMLSALNEMGTIFTSFEFNKAAVKYGYPAELLKHKGLHQYLKKYARLLNPWGRTWQKSSRYIQTIPLIDDASKIRDYSIPASNDNSKLEDAIQIVKQAGYKVSKKVTEWIEI